jgi:hypothetical protein
MSSNNAPEEKQKLAIQYVMYYLAI